MREEFEDEQPFYLDFDGALELYGLVIGVTAEQAPDYLRNRGGLESALERPRTHAFYEDADLAEQAATLAHGIAESQCFIDGNKRLALVCMLVFLEINGYNVEASDRELADWILDFSSGSGPREVAERLRGRLRPAA